MPLNSVKDWEVFFAQGRCNGGDSYKHDFDKIGTRLKISVKLGGKDGVVYTDQHERVLRVKRS